jgi:organic radical activating enzyme
MSTSKSNEPSIKMNKPFTNITHQEIDDSKVFCVLPWIHLHVTPAGRSAPCCISESCNFGHGMGDATKLNLNELMNSEGMKQLRLDMLNGVKNAECTKCYEHEEQGATSWRQGCKSKFTDSIHEIQNTNSDGSLDDFKLKYYDMRFSNICNFKCRTCTQEYSTQWEQENLRNGVPHANQIPKNNNTVLLEDVFEKIDSMELAYFAGGEPLLMDQHYVILEEMIRRNKTDIKLIYNSNISTLKYKSKDIIDLWSRFSNPIQMNASIDHVGKRAEYIRHGTDWGVIESNFKSLRKHDFVEMTMNTVLSVFNYLTFDQFCSYLIDNDMYAKNLVYQVYNMSSPSHYTCHILPENLKRIGEQSMHCAVLNVSNLKINPTNVEVLDTARSWALSKTTTYDIAPESGNLLTNIEMFKREVERLDKIRGEKFEDVFPELRPLLEL